MDGYARAAEGPNPHEAFKEDKKTSTGSLRAAHAIERTFHASGLPSPETKVSLERFAGGQAPYRQTSAVPCADRRGRRSVAQLAAVRGPVGVAAALFSLFSLFSSAFSSAPGSGGRLSGSVPGAT